MKNALFGTAAILLMISAASGADAQSDNNRPGETATIAKAADGLPHILNDLPWTKVCPRNREICDTEGASKTDARRS